MGFHEVLRGALAVPILDPEGDLRSSVSLVSQRAQLVELRRLRLHRRTGRQRDQDGKVGWVRADQLEPI